MGLLTVLRALIEQLTQEQAYLRLYLATVLAAHDDHTIDVMPEESKIQGFGQRVPYYVGTPGWSSDPVVGDKVLLGFADGDPSKPYAILSAADRSCDTAIFKGGTLPVARKGDKLDCGSLSFAFVPGPTATLAVVYTPPPDPITGIPNLPTMLPAGSGQINLIGYIASGREDLLA